MLVLTMYGDSWFYRLWMHLESDGTLVFWTGGLRPPSFLKTLLWGHVDNVGFMDLCMWLNIRVRQKSNASTIHKPKLYLQIQTSSIAHTSQQEMFQKRRWPKNSV